MNQQNHPTTSEIETALGLSRENRRGRMFKRALMALTVLAVVAAGYWLYAANASSTSAVTYETTPAKIADVVVTVSATGTIQPITQVDIGSEASGVVREVRVDENDVVKVGDILATLDTTRLDAQRDKAAAQLEAAEARVSQAQITLNESRQTENRQKALRQKGLSTAQDMDTAVAVSKRAETALAVALAEVASVKADLAVFDADISKTRILSPIDGVILKRSVEPGQTVASSLQAPVLFQIAQDLTRIQLEAAVDEADIGEVQVGQSAAFTVDAYRNRNFPAKIERLSFAPETVDGVVTYKAVLSAANEDLALRPGMTATARITIEEHKGVLTVQNEALRYQPPAQQQAESFSITNLFMPRFPRGTRAKREVAADGTRAIYVLRDGKPAALRVKTGASDGKLTRIESGDLKADDAVVIGQKQSARSGG